MATPIINASKDDWKDSGDVQPFTAEVGNVRRKQGEHCLHWRIVQTLLQLRCQPAHGETNTDAARGDKKKLESQLSQRKGTGHHGGHCETERDKRSGDVYQAFTFENDNNLAGHPQSL